MGLRGPARKPTALKVLEGTVRPSRMPQNEPKPAPALLPCPKGLSPVARAEWQRVVPELHRLGLLTVVDRSSLVGYVMSYSRALAAEKALQKDGITVETGAGYLQAHPAVSIARNEWAAVRKFASEFGLTPASRTRISAPEKPQADGAKDAIFGSKPRLHG